MSGLALGPAEELRLFFAVTLAPELRSAAAEIGERIALSRAKVKWVEEPNLHFTLKFLGEMLGQTVPMLAEVGRQVAARHAAFDLEISGAGAFPRVSDARAIWLGCVEGAEPMEALAADLDGALVQSGLAAAEDRPFRAHLTIGRNKSDYRASELARAIKAVSTTKVGRMHVDRFVLYRSELAPEGPTYTVLEEFALTG